MENIMELEIGRQVCLRKIDGLTREIQSLVRKSQSIDVEVYEISSDKKQLDVLVRESAEWQKRYATIDSKMFELVEKNF